MAVGGETRDGVLRPSDQEPHRIGTAAIFLVLVDTSRCADDKVDERSEMKLPGRLDEMQSRRAGERDVPVLLVRRVWRDETGEQNRRVQHDQEAHRRANLSRRGAHTWSARTRGSDRYNKASATRLPASRNSVEHITAPT